MLFSNEQLLKHIHEEVEFIINESSVRTREALVTDPVLSRAVIRSLEIIGECFLALQIILAIPLL